MGGRFYAKVEAAPIILRYELGDEEALADAWVRVVDVLNVPLYREWEEDTRVALENMKNRLDYTRLAGHGPKLGEITEE